MVPWTHLSPQTKWHHDWFSRFCSIHDSDRQTDRPRYSVCNNRLYLCTQYCDVLIVQYEVRVPMSCIRSEWVWNQVRFGRASISSRCSNMFWALFAFSSVTLSSFSSLSASSIAPMSSSNCRIRSRYFSIISTSNKHTRQFHCHLPVVVSSHLFSNISTSYNTRTPPV